MWKVMQLYRGRRGDVLSVHRFKFMARLAAFCYNTFMPDAVIDVWRA